MFALWLLVACSQDPVLVGLAEEVGEEEEASSGPVRYEKAEGVLVDVAYLGGRGWDKYGGRWSFRWARFGGGRSEVETGWNSIGPWIDSGSRRPGSADSGRPALHHAEKPSA